MDKRVYSTNYGDDVIVKFDSGSFHCGQVRMISERGINVSSPWGDKFVKWCNVVEIKKPQSEEK